MNLPPIIAGFGPLGTPELVIIGVLILILFGAKKLPMFARSLGKSMGEFKKAREEFETELHRAQEEVSKPSLPEEKVEREKVSAAPSRATNDEV
ncbi:MAG: twin-arginine translocase TatA/TatE family subunit [Verrucomicrobiales bacterium]|nr:twin-arginine translocase TatA/TatE family subunit [Verrucomicrobiales bacterium]